MKKWITCIIMAVMMAAMIFMGTGNNVFADILYALKEKMI